LRGEFSPHFERKGGNKANVEKLNALIDYKGIKKIWLADQLGITQQTLINKLSGANDFKLQEVNTLCKILNISEKETKQIFFND
jgi:DNA-binding Xre family transcriptional regulator